MLILRIIVSGLYAGLLLFASFSKYKETKKLDILMFIGAPLLLIANVLGYIPSLVVAAAGLLIIHAAALINGKNSGKINITHHLVRLIISIIVFMLFWFSQGL